MPVCCREAMAKAIDKAVFPGLQERPAQSHHCRHRGCPERGFDAGFQGLCRAGRREREGACRHLAGHGFKLVSGERTT